MPSHNNSNGEFKNWLATKRLQLEHQEVQAWSSSFGGTCIGCGRVHGGQGYRSKSGGNDYDNHSQFTSGFCPDCLS